MIAKQPPSLAAASRLHEVAPRSAGPQQLAALAHLQGPCVSLFLQMDVDGQEWQQQFRQLCEEVKMRVGWSRASCSNREAWPDVDDWPVPNRWEHACQGLALFGSANKSVAFFVSEPLRCAVAGSYPHVLPLVDQAAMNRALFALDLREEDPQLFAYADGAARAVPAADGASSLAGVRRGGKEPDRYTRPTGFLMQRATMQPDERGRFGLPGLGGAARSPEEERYAWWESRSQERIGSLPLLLLGTREQLSAYRRVSRHPSLLNSELDGVGPAGRRLALTEVGSRARAAAYLETLRQGLTGLAQQREMRDHRRAVSGPQRVYEAAARGAVERIFLRSQTESYGRLGDLPGCSGFAHEDLMNASAVETLRGGGEVFVLPGEHMPLSDAMCAVLRA